MERSVAVVLFVLFSGGVFAGPARRTPRAAEDNRGNSMDSPLQVWTHEAFVCVAAVIADKFALTAAHCFNEPDPSMYYLLGGSARLNGTDGTQFNINKIMKHPSFDANTKNYDIAVIRIVASFLELPNAVFITLQNTFISSPSEQDCLVVGWGIIGNGIAYDTMYTTPMQISPQVKYINNLKFYRNITSQMFCAESEVSDVCRGDSGAGLICSGRLAGLVSWDMDKCKGRGPTVFTRVSNYEIRKFIRDQTGV